MITALDKGGVATATRVSKHLRRRIGDAIENRCACCAVCRWRRAAERMADDGESEELVMIAEKARALLSRSERRLLAGHCSSYLAGAMSVKRFVDALQRLLPTPDKVRRGPSGGDR